VEVPAGGAAAAAPEGGCYRMPVGTQSYQLVVDTGSPIAMPCLARYRAKRGEPTIAIRAINNFRESRVRRAFKTMICTLPAPRSPGRPVRWFFSRQYSSRIPSSYLGAGWGLYLRSVLRRSGCGGIDIEIVLQEVSSKWTD
jgi:hypothetical protein